MSFGLEIKYSCRVFLFSSTETDSFLVVASTVGGGEKKAAATRGLLRLKRAKKTAVAATAAKPMVLRREKGKWFGVSVKWVLGFGKRGSGNEEEEEEGFALIDDLRDDGGGGGVIVKLSDEMGVENDGRW